MTDESVEKRSVLDTSMLADLLRQLSASNIDELELADGASRIFIRREPGKVTYATGGERPETRETDGVPIPAPLTGVYYARPAPEQPVFVSPGDEVAPGQVIALIETMKLFNEVVTDLAGEVLEIIPSEGSLVEAGQPLMYVRPMRAEESAQSSE